MTKLTETTRISSPDEDSTPKGPAESPAADALNRPADPTAPIRPPQPEVRVDDSKISAAYANFCRVTGTPEELIIDFGLNTQPMQTPTEPIVATQRIVLNYYTAKRFLTALQLSVQRHETAFGVLETDVQKRATTTVRRAARPS